MVLGMAQGRSGCTAKVYKSLARLSARSEMQRCGSESVGLS